MNAALGLHHLLNDLWHESGRSLLTLLVLALITASYLLIAALGKGFATFGEVNQPSFNLLIISNNIVNFSDSSLDLPTLEQSASYIQQNFGAGAVTSISPMIFRHMRIQDHAIQVFAAPPQDFGPIYRMPLSEGVLPEGVSQLAATENIVQQRGWQLGDTIQVYGRDFRLTGILRPVGRRSASIWMPYTAGLNLFGSQRGFQIGVIQLARGVQAGTVQNNLEDAPHIAGRYAVYQENQLDQQFGAAVRSLLALSGALSVIALLVVIFGSYSAASLTVNERSRDLQLLQVLGFQRRTLSLLLMVRTNILALAAYGLACGAVWLLLPGWSEDDAIIFWSTPMRLELSAGVVLTGLFLTLLCASLGVWFSTRLLSDLDAGLLRGS